MNVKIKIYQSEKENEGEIEGECDGENKKKSTNANVKVKKKFIKVKRKMMVKVRMKVMVKMKIHNRVAKVKDEKWKNIWMVNDDTKFVRFDIWWKFPGIRVKAEEQWKMKILWMSHVPVWWMNESGLFSFPLLPFPRLEPVWMNTNSVWAS